MKNNKCIKLIIIVNNLDFEKEEEEEKEEEGEGEGEKEEEEEKEEREEICQKNFSQWKKHFQ